MGMERGWVRKGEVIDGLVTLMEAGATQHHRMS